MAIHIHITRDSLERCAGILFAHDEGPTRNVLLLKRSDTGQWALPGGHIEYGESPVDAAIRETLEECNVVVHGMPELLATRRYGNLEFTTFIAKVQDPFDPQLNHEHVDYKWVSANDASEWPKEVHPGLKEVLMSTFGIT